MSVHFHLICGGREFRDAAWMTDHIAYVRDRDAQQGDETVVVTGGARGADKLAESVAHELGLKVISIPAEWDRYGKSAGYKRNQRMARYLVERTKAGQRASVVAFPGGKGTAHMRDIAKSFGLGVFSPRPQPVHA